jgi:mRNA-degrading endonuclease RelE of RelBE toxin-antitoxin system
VTAGGLRIAALDFTERFKKELNALSPDLRTQVDEVLSQLLQYPIPRGLRFHKLNGYRNPCLYSVTVTGNDSHKVSFSIDGNIAVLRRIATHRRIDRNP